MIRPIDMQVIIPKTSEISRQHHGEAQKGEVEQHQFAQQMEKQVYQNQQQVVSSNKPESTVNQDGRNKSQYQKNHSKKQKNKNQKDKKEDSTKSSIIDIRI
ncbi:MAG: hypothetical protein GX308_01610 [Epulopiscium sp.]|nr:hypothetical protein [Candidatus Epulonipiscium sp.]